MTNQLLAQTVVEAEDILNALHMAADNLAGAMARESVIAGYKRETETFYADAEAEFAFEAMMSIEGKNAEIRKAGLDAALVAARTTGPLAESWRMKLAQADAYAQARNALDMAQVRYGATKHAADLKAAILRALSA